MILFNISVDNTCATKTMEFRRLVDEVIHIFDNNKMTSQTWTLHLKIQNAVVL